MTFDEFRAKWLGNRVDYDRQLQYQCVDLIRQGFKEMHNLAGGGGVPRAINYWTTTPQDVLQKFNQVSNSEAQKGDVVILWGLNGNPDGHIGWATGGLNPTQLEILEQNGQTGSGTGTGGDAIRTRWISRTRVAGLLRPVATPQTAPVAASPNTYMSYTQASGTKRTNKVLTKWWNLNNPTTNIDNFQPASILQLHTPFPIGGYATNRNFPQYRYAMTPEDYARAVQGDYSTNNGVNEADLEDIPAPEPKPYIPPAPPVTAPPAKKLTLVTTLLYFDKPEEAKRRENAKGPIFDGEYFVVKEDEQAWKLSKDNKTDIGWVNTFDNKLPEPPVTVVTPVPEPVPAPVVPTLPIDAPQPDITLPVDDTSATASDLPKPQYYPIFPDRHAVSLTSTNTTPVPIKDLEGKWPKQTLPARQTEDYVMFAEIKGKQYFIIERLRQKGWMYAVSEDLLPEPPDALHPSIFDRDADGKNDVAETWDQFIDFASKNYQRISDVITPLKPKLEQTKQRAVKTIDGFRARSKK
jgi:hypothetical protein